MPRYAYTAIDSSGRTVQATIDTHSRKDAVRQIAARGLRALQLTEAAASRPAAGPSAGPSADTAGAAGIRGLNRSLRLPFVEALADLTESGLSAGEAVRILSMRLQDKRLKLLCQQLWSRLSEGRALSEAMGELPSVFDPSTISLIRAGEATGNLHEVLVRLLNYFNDQKELRANLVKAMLYPAIIICVAGVVLLILFFFVLPRMQVLFDTLGSKMPFITRTVFELGDFVVHKGWITALAAAAGAIAFSQWRRTPSGRMTTDGWLLRIPLIGNFIVRSTAQRFSDTLAVLLENGITTADALRMTERTVQNRVMHAAFMEACDRVLEGEPLSRALSRSNRLPALVIDRLAIGENTGNIAPSLRSLARSLQKDLSRDLQSFLTVFSTGVLLLAFVIVGFVAAAILLGILGVSASFKF